METKTPTATITYAASNTIDAGFSLGQPLLDILLDGTYAGCLFRSYRNEGRRLVETWQLHLKGGRPHGPKFDTLEELILFAQDSLI